MIDKTPEQIIALLKESGATRESGWLDWHITDDQLQAFAAALTAAQPVQPAMQSAAQAVLDRWNSPKWEWHKNGPTADLMADLYAAIKATSHGIKGAQS